MLWVFLLVGKSLSQKERALVKAKGCGASNILVDDRTQI
jgi:hypothetical protein